jgi:Tfp pilus assembly protein PilN
MRPINLIPPEQRRGLDAPIRTGPLAYLTIAALAGILIAVLALVTTSNTISHRRADLASLEQRKAAAEAKLQSLQPFATLRTVADQRTATVSNLARSRFDWVRVMNELSRVLPSDVWLVNITGTVNPQVQADGGAKVTTRDSVDGPALELIGCTTSHDAVAGFVSDLKEIDGVTRVGVNSSDRPDRTTAGSTAASGDDCRTKDSVTRFEIVVAFDNVPNPGVAQSAPAAPGATASGGATATPASAQASTNGSSSTLVSSP